ncbi:hypothetical protein [Thermofilum sp.]|jgi:uncharacterized membrane protein|uniref:hypothetical protein n=1 Tax=Thermofilum sp. TaxID=1961369 RepID=UPI00258933E4|nr:hypothetical protein [Thermofilum sp.]
MTKMKRKGISSVATVIIFLATIVSATLVMAYFFISTKSATSQPLLEISDAYYISNSIIFTIRNIGSVDVTASSISITCPSATASYSTSTSIPKGTAQSIKATVSTGGTINDGDLCVAQVTLSSPDSTSLALSFRVIKP